MLNNGLSLEKGFFHIITGPNGTGKSRMLRILSESALKDEKYSRVICLSRGGYDDWFKISYQNEFNNKYFYLGVGTYLEFSRSTFFKKLFKRLFERLFNVFQQDCEDFLDSYRKKRSFRKKLSLIRKLLGVIGFECIVCFFRKENGEKRDWLFGSKFPRFFNDSFYIHKITFIKNDRSCEFHELSSGERSILLMILGVTLTIKDNSIIFYDEPENSMHPKWQEYIISFLQEIVMLSCNSTVVIATHSPLVVSNVTVSNKKIITLGEEDSNWKNYSNNSNIEDTLYKVFNKITPKSYLLSVEISKIVKDMLDGEISKRDAINKLNGFRSAGIDHVQENVIDNVISSLGVIKNKLNAEKANYE